MVFGRVTVQLQLFGFPGGVTVQNFSKINSDFVALLGQKFAKLCDASPPLTPSPGGGRIGV